MLPWKNKDGEEMLRFPTFESSKVLFFITPSWPPPIRFSVRSTLSLWNIPRVNFLLHSIFIRWMCAVIWKRWISNQLSNDPAVLTEIKQFYFYGIDLQSVKSVVSIIIFNEDSCPFPQQRERQITLICEFQRRLLHCCNSYNRRSCHFLKF